MRRYAIFLLGTGQHGFVLTPKIDTARHAGIRNEDRAVFLPLFNALGRTRNGIKDALLALSLAENVHQLFTGEPVIAGHLADKLSHLGRAFIVAGHRALRRPEQT